MKINTKILSIPPYISTSWNNVVAIHMKDTSLVVSLVDGDIIEIPGLTSDIIETIFVMHATFLENDIAGFHNPRSKTPMHASSASSETPLRFGFTTLDALGDALQHNPAQGDAPDIPPDVLQKITAIAKIVAPGDVNAFPKPEPHCNCLHCQIARAITTTLDISVIEEIEVTDKDLSFSEWDIEQTADKVYTVKNHLDPKEEYRVFLGDPVGCTCGINGCEHVLAVLKS